VRNEKRVKNKVGNCEGERPFVRSKRRRKNAIEWDFTESGQKVINCVCLVRDNGHLGASNADSLPLRCMKWKKLIRTAFLDAFCPLEML